MKFKKLKDQVIVITGATSGIGLVTTRKAAKAGARLVLVARDESSLRALIEEIKNAGGDAAYCVADVSDEAQVREIGRVAKATFGGFDTWINNAGLAIYGQIDEISTEDHRRLFDINFWGIVYGSLEAARHFRERESKFAGGIINIGSTVSDRAIPVQGMYSVTKHAVKGFTDALRMELAHEGVPVALSLIKPGAIDTPFPQHARNYMKEEPTLPPPVYAPELVANAILHCVEAPQREVSVGGGGRVLSMMGQYFPNVGDKLLMPRIFKEQRKDEPAKNRPDTLYQAGFGLNERGENDNRTTIEYSPYTKVITNPLLKSVLLVGALLLAATLVNDASEK